MVEDWNTDDALAYLRRKRTINTAFNDDYRRFLYFDLWKLNEKPCRILDVGCGTGLMAWWMLPHFPAGTSYTGIDIAPRLLDDARRNLTDLPHPAEFVESSAYAMPFPGNSFDLVVTNCVLMHLERPLEAIDEMIRVARPGGLIVTHEANRNAAAALLNIDEVNELEEWNLGLTQRLNRAVRERTGVDYNIGIRIPVIFHRKGLRDIDCRQNDKVCWILPPDLTEEMENLYQYLVGAGMGPLNDEGEKRWRRFMLEHGATEEEADRTIGHYRATDFAKNGRHYHTVVANPWIFCKGTVVKKGSG